MSVVKRSRIRQDIDTTKKILEEVEDIAVLIAEGVKEGWSMVKTFKVIKTVSDIAALAQEMDELLPELKDLDKREAEELAGIIYDAVKKVADVVQKEDEK